MRNQEPVHRAASALASRRASRPLSRFSLAPSRLCASSRARRSAFTIVEIIVVIVIIGILATLIAPRLLSRVGQAKQSTAKANANTLASEVNKYILDCGPLPPGATLDILVTRPPDVDASKWQGPYLQNADQLKDPWGNAFILVVPGKKNVDFDIVSYGADGQEGGEGENGDVIAP